MDKHESVKCHRNAKSMPHERIKTFENMVTNYSANCIPRQLRSTINDSQSSHNIPISCANTLHSCHINNENHEQPFSYSFRFISYVRPCAIFPPFKFQIWDTRGKRRNNKGKIQYFSSEKLYRQVQATRATKRPSLFHSAIFSRIRENLQIFQYFYF